MDKRLMLVAVALFTVAFLLLAALLMPAGGEKQGSGAVVAAQEAPREAAEESGQGEKETAAEGSGEQGELPAWEPVSVDASGRAEDVLVTDVEGLKGHLPQKCAEGLSGGLVQWAESTGADLDEYGCLFEPKSVRTDAGEVAFRVIASDELGNEFFIEAVWSEGSGFEFERG